MRVVSSGFYLLCWQTWDSEDEKPDSKIVSAAEKLEYKKIKDTIENDKHQKKDALNEDALNEDGTICDNVKI